MSKFLDLLIAHLKGAAIKAALVHLIKTSVGIKAWIVKFLIEELFEEIVEPLTKLALRKVKYEYRKHEGEVIIEKIKEARENKNEDDYNSHVDDIFR